MLMRLHTTNRCRMDTEISLFLFDNKSCIFRLYQRSDEAISLCSEDVKKQTYVRD